MNIRLLTLVLSLCFLAVDAADKKFRVGASKGLHVRTALAKTQDVREGHSKTPREALEDLGIFTVFLRAMRSVGLDGMLDGSQKLTIFAPTDHVFKQMPQDTIEAMFEPDNRLELYRMLRNHIVLGSYDSKDLVNGTRLRSFHYQHDLVISTSLNGTIQKIASVMILPFDIYNDDMKIYAVDGVISDTMLHERKIKSLEFSFDDLFEFEY